ncbi:MAG: ABC transporter permease [Gemmatimonadota bacterium]
MTHFQDLRYGARLMRRKPMFSAIAVLTLGLGIGLTATMFSIVNGAILKGLPFDESDRLVSVTRSDMAQGSENMAVPLHDFEEWREEQRVFEVLAGYTTGTFNVRGSEGAERYSGGWMTANAFDVLRARPILGRTFVEGEDAPGAELVTVISHRIWQDRFGGDPVVLGQTLFINGEQATIVGVMGERFMFPVSQLLWLPERRQAIDFQRGGPGTPFLQAFGRLRPEVSIDRANLEMSRVAAGIAEAHPATNENIGVKVQPFTDLFIGDEPRRMLFVMLGGVFCVLLIACANVANLLLGQAALRSKEIAVRSALGATRGRVIMQFLTEPLVLAFAGAGLGVGIAWVGIRLFERALVATEPPFWLDFSIDGTVLLFVVAITLFATLVSGLLPAIRASGGDMNETLKDDSRGASSFRGGRWTTVLVIGEVSLSVVLLVAAGLMIRSVTELASIDFGFTTEDIFTARLGIPEADQGYSDVARRIRFFEEVEARLATEPSVRSVALTNSLPGFSAPSNRSSIEGREYATPTDHPSVRTAVITPGFFSMLGVAPVEGRVFGAEDREDGLPVAIVNRGLVDLHFPEGDVIGSRIRLGGTESQEPWLTIVGVVPDLFMAGVQNENPAGLYTPLAQSSNVRFMSISARTSGPALMLTPRVREAVGLVDADIPIYWVRTLAEGIQQENWFFRIFGGLFTVMGAAALFLAAIGLYGVMSFSVSRRTKEMGVRMALGAQRQDVIRLIMRQGAWQLALGISMGLAGAWATSSLLTNFLFGVESRDPLTFLGTILVLVAVGLVASWVPALRATRADPLVAMRDDHMAHSAAHSQPGR